MQGELCLEWIRLTVGTVSMRCLTMKQFALQIALIGTLLACPASVRSQSVLANGNIAFLELGFNNSNVNNPFWVVRINDLINNVFYTPTFNSSLGRFVFDAPGGARFLIDGPQHLFERPLSSSWSFIGVGPGEQFRATPQNGDPASQLVMAVATIGVDNGIFVNNQMSVTMSVTGISNPGEFSYYSNDDPPNDATGNLGTVLLSTLDNLTSFNRFSGTQSNFNMAFSDPGIYQVDFQFSGDRTVGSGGGTITSSFYRYTFEVGLFSVPEPATWGLIGITILGSTVGFWMYRRQQRRIMEGVLLVSRDE